eukprot:CAMPEP_0118725226 /NCGR_PEP_ID=MMETSP0800-20121206/33025_1 /TAXON_ID=210618 ORGANISM="Striatella unipunctata, Strain CCMP2910" /NCGR_SAMPLE_ID=MMETSP0800 /ASSEMBLY_ACC=CAM_ASM_000638 /LENGTH=234 /DNA_ID=CAMNT_0006633907 /DNA_START=103 /DNA_END=807 /DNA_ORIENTATION=-
MGAMYSSVCMDSSSVSNSTSTTTRAPTISSIDRAVLDLKNTRDRLTRYKKKLVKEEESLLQRAKICCSREEKNDVKTAINLLKLRKYKNKQVEDVDGQLLTVLKMVDSIQTKEQEADVLVALKAGKDALARMHETLSLESVMELMDRVEEENELEQQINDVFMGVDLSAVDEAAIEEELAALEQATVQEHTTLAEQLPKAPTTTEQPLVFPTVPTKEPSSIATTTTTEPVAVAS